MSDTETMLESLISRVEELKEENARLQHELQLAIAHDRQPYPTAEAYELACKIREKFRQRVEELESMLAAKDEALERQTGTFSDPMVDRERAYAARRAISITPASLRARRDAELKVIEAASVYAALIESVRECPHGVGEEWEIKESTFLASLAALDALDALTNK